MNEKILKVIRTKWFQWGLLGVAGITALIPIIGSIIKTGVDCDSAYYICIAERIIDGFKPYVDVNLGYTPLYIYIMAFLKWACQIPTGMYWPYLLLHYLMQIGISFAIYGIAHKFGSSKRIAIFGAWLYLMMSHWLHGNAVLLEIPSVFFGMVSICLLLLFKDKNKWNNVWIGTIAACSFLSKQYGLGFLVLDLFIMMVINRRTWKECSLFILGYIIPICCCILIFGNAFIQGVFNGYGTTAAASAGYDISLNAKISSIIENLWYFYYMVCPFILVCVFCFGEAIKQRRIWTLMVGILGILGFSLEFYFSGGQLHYYQYQAPFAILIITEILSINNVKWVQYLKYVLLVWVVVVTFYKTYNNRVYKQYIKGNKRTEQLLTTEKIKEYIGPNDKIWIVHGGEYYLYFTMNNLPPNIETIGYSFGPMGLNEQQGFEMAKSTDWVIRYSKDYDFEVFFTDSLKHFVEQYPAISIGDSAILLHKMH